jgi:FkbM family methyltransferase
MKHAIGRFVSRVIKFLSRMAGLDLIRLGYAENGIGQSHSFEASGERKFVQEFLPVHLNIPEPVIFDVGANRGDYSKLLLTAFPKAKLMCFEPNPRTFELLSRNLGNSASLFQNGFGKQSGTLELHFDAKDQTSVMATSNPEILRNISKVTETEKVQIKVETLDEFCTAQKIGHIDFLKVDTEGFELDILRGAKKMLDEKCINIIQFEFNETGAIQRIFLRDFYELLKGFDFYRLGRWGMIPLGDWQPAHEIFLFQNIVAIRRKS